MYRPAKAAKPPKRRVLKMLISILIISVAYSSFAVLRPLTPVTSTLTPPVIAAQAQVKVPWPAASQAAFGANDYGLLATHGAEVAKPMASVAKVLTALAVLEKKPLKVGEQGPSMVMTAADVQIYNDYVAGYGSVVPINEGESVTQYQALQALLLPSANNLADTMAIWAFGSMANYVSYANAYSVKHGMPMTRVADASGYSPSTVSTAADLVRLGDIALDHPVLVEIVGQRTASFPGVGTITNVNSLLGKSGVLGIKTGNTDEAGGCFLGAATINVGGQNITVITAIMGAPDLGQALRESMTLVTSAPAQFSAVPVIRTGQNVGKVTSAWGASSALIAQSEMVVTAWNGTALSPRATPSASFLSKQKGSKAGSMQLDFNKSVLRSDVRLERTVEEPGVWWRLTHPI